MKSDWSNASYWEHFYNVADTPWELGQASPVLQEAVSEARALGAALHGASVLVPGCGTGSDAAWLAERGASVLAVDFSPQAVERAAARRSNLSVAVAERITLKQCDFFEEAFEGFSFLAEHTFFCAIDPGSRERYARSVARALVPGGYLVGNFFVMAESEIAARRTLSLREGEPRPPFVTSVSELQRLFLALFEQLSLRPARNPSPDRRPGIEWVGVFRRK